MPNLIKKADTIAGIPTIGPNSTNESDNSLYGLRGCLWRANDKGEYKACVWSYKIANKLIGQNKYRFGEEAVIRFGEDRLPEFIAELRIRRWPSDQIAIAETFNTNYMGCY